APTRRDTGGWRGGRVNSRRVRAGAVVRAILLFHGAVEPRSDPPRSAPRARLLAGRLDLPVRAARVRGHARVQPLSLAARRVGAGGCRPARNAGAGDRAARPVRAGAAHAERPDVHARGHAALVAPPPPPRVPP